MLRVVYFFAGARRKSSMRGELLKACAGTGVRVDLSEIDVLQGGDSHDLLRGSLQAYWLEKVRKGEVDAILASPPCCTFSRARNSAGPGPRPMRSRSHPRGMPHLDGPSRAAARNANDLVDFTVRVVSEQLMTQDLRS